jgi:hypothetical protein
MFSDGFSRRKHCEIPRAQDSDEGMADVEAGRVVPWDLEEFLE